MNAQTPTGSAIAADSAKLLWDQGLTAYRQGSMNSLRLAIEIWNRSLAFSRRARNRIGQGAALNHIGVAYHDLGQPDSALAYYERALVIRREIKDRESEGVTLHNLGAVYRGLGQPDSALAYYGRALVIGREVGDRKGEAVTLNSLGLVYDDLGQPDSALVYLGRALVIRREVGDRGGEGVTLSNLGLAYHGLGRTDSALAYFGRALVIEREARHRRGEGTILNNIGAAHNRLGRSDSALAYFSQSLAISREVGDRRGEGRAASNLGGVYHDLGRRDSALAYHRRALAIRREVGDRPGEGETLNALGLAYDALGMLDSALAFFREGLVIMREVGDRRSEGATLSHLGDMHSAFGRPDSAVTYYSSSLAISQEVGDRHGEAATLNDLGTVFAELGLSDAALLYYGRSLSIGRQIGDRQSEGVTLGNVGAQYRSLPDGLATASAYYDSAASVKAAMAEATGGDPNRLSFAEQGFFLFESWALTWLARAPEVGAERARLAALAAAERGRAQALLDLIRVTSRQGKALPGGTVATKAPVTDLVAYADSLLRPLRRARRSALSYLVTSDTLIIWLALPSSPLQVVRRPIGRARLDTLVAALRASIWATSARSSGQARGDLAPESDTALLRSMTVDSLVRHGRDSLLKYVATLLLPREFVPELPQGAELVIVPHSILALVPFAALPSDMPGIPLGIKYALRYTPSLATLAEVEARDSPLGTWGARKTALRRALVVGDPAMPPDPDRPDTWFPPLDQARLEAYWLAERLDVRLLSDSVASETVVRQRLPRATLVHLATHGRAYNSDAFARASFVVLAPDRMHPDGLLTVGELLDDSTLTLHEVELVVLSACQTGLGDLKEAEGTVGLQRAFVAKGARSVLVSLWNVQEDATRLLMEKFYTYWLNERQPVGKAEALRLAQADVRGIRQFRAPYFWAGFQLVGAQ